MYTIIEYSHGESQLRYYSTGHGFIYRAATAKSHKPTHAEGCKTLIRVNNPWQHPFPLTTVPLLIYYSPPLL